MTSEQYTLNKLEGNYLCFTLVMVIAGTQKSHFVPASYAPTDTVKKNGREWLLESRGTEEREEGKELIHPLLLFQCG